jgi:hypothetical protein
MECACPLFVGAPEGHIAFLLRPQNRPAHAANSANPDTNPLQSIQGRSDVVTMSVFY